MRQYWNIGLGAFSVCLSLVMFFVWIPLDTETDAVEVFRRARSIGDAMLPYALAILMGLVGLVMMWQGYFAVSKNNQPVTGAEETGLGASRLDGDCLTRDNAIFLVTLLLIIAASLAAMYWLGPIILKLASVFGQEVTSYRLVRATAPWKYTGYFCGGSFMVFTLISLVEQKILWRNVFIATAAVIVLIIAYDVPFDNLLLPPNGDY